MRYDAGGSGEARQVHAVGAIVIGGYVNGLGVVRALAARGVPAAVVRTKPYDIAQHSRWSVASDAALDTEDESDALVEVLERRAADWAGWVLLPTNDGALSAVARHRERLARRYRLLVPPWEVTRQLVDKSLTLDVARAAGVATPHCWGPADEATAARPDLVFPVLVKPDVSHLFVTRFRAKLLVARDRDELRAAIAAVAAAGLSCRVYDRVPGGDDAIHAYCTYVDRGGEPAPGLFVRKLRQSPPSYGVARVAEIAEDVPELREATVAMLRRIGFRGIAAAEFKRDPRDGVFRLLEINGRSVLYNALLRRAGLDLAGLAWSEAALGRAGGAAPNGWRGVWIEPHADVLYSLLFRRHQRIGLREFLAPYRRPKVQAVWSSRDPAPFAAQWLGTARAGFAAARRREGGSIVVDRTRVTLTA